MIGRSSNIPMRGMFINAASRRLAMRSCVVATLSAVGMYGLAATPVTAASITFQTPVPISDSAATPAAADANGQISTDGTFVGATLFDSASANATATTANGVTFIRSTQDGGNQDQQDGQGLNLIEPHGFIGNGGVTVSGNSTGDPGYDKILANIAIDTSVEPINITAPLNTGHTYQIQIWSTQNSPNAYVTQFTSGSDVVDVPLGDYVVGTFTADGITPSLTYESGTSASVVGIVNTIQIRDLGVPEPASLAIAGVGGLLLLARRRRI